MAFNVFLYSQSQKVFISKNRKDHFFVLAFVSETSSLQRLEKVSLCLWPYICVLLWFYFLNLNSIAFPKTKDYSFWPHNNKAPHNKQSAK